MRDNLETEANIERMLADSDPEVRRQAVIEIAATGSGFPRLIKAAGDPDWRVRKTAVEALVAVGTPEIVEGMYNWLFSDDNAGARNSAAETLVKLAPMSIKFLCDRISEPDDDVRKFIVDILGEIGDPAGAPALIKALTDVDVNVRASAIEHLGRLKAAEAMAPLVNILRTEDQWMAFTAAAALGELGDKRAVGPLMEAANDRYLREAALEALYRLGALDAWPVFIEALADHVAVIREMGIKGFASIFKAAEDTEPLRVSLHDRFTDEDLQFTLSCLDADDDELRSGAAVVLGVARAKTAVDRIARLLLYEETSDAAYLALSEITRGGVEPMLFLLTDEEATIRSAAASILGRSGDTRVVNFLIPLLSDENGHTRRSAAGALGRLGDAKASLPLLELLRDEYEDVQEEAIGALGMIKDPAIIGYLKEFARDDEPAMRRNVSALLGLMGGIEPPKILRGLLKDEDAEVRRTAVMSLGRAGGETTLRDVQAALTDEDQYVRMAAVNVLSQQKSKDAAEALGLLLNDQDPWVRAAAVRGLSSINGAGLVNIILPLMSDSYGPVRIAVLDALGKTRSREGLDTIKKYLNDKDAEIRTSAAAALVNYPDEDLTAPLSELLKDANWSVRKTAVEVIGELGQPGYRETLEKIFESTDEETVRLTARRYLDR